MTRHLGRAPISVPPAPSLEPMARWLGTCTIYTPKCPKFTITWKHRIGSQRWFMMISLLESSGYGPSWIYVEMSTLYCSLVIFSGQWASFCLFSQRTVRNCLHGETSETSCCADWLGIIPLSCCFLAWNIKVQSRSKNHAIPSNLF